MHWQFTLYEIPYAIATVVSLWLLNVAWWRRYVPGALGYGLLMFAVAEWSLGIVLAQANVGFPVIVVWNNVPLLGIVIVPAALLVFSLQYTGRSRWLTPPVILVLMIEPLITLLLVWTNSRYGLIANSTSDKSASFTTQALTYGSWFWINAVYSYLLVVLSTFLLFWHILSHIRSDSIYRGQVIAFSI